MTRNVLAVPQGMTATPLDAIRLHSLRAPMGMEQSFYLKLGKEIKCPEPNISLSRKFSSAVYYLAQYIA